jgi:hypothetical protein
VCPRLVVLLHLAHRNALRGDSVLSVNYRLIDYDIIIINVKALLDLFNIRDTAVEKHDRELLLSTQLQEINEASSEGYLALASLHSQILGSCPMPQDTQAVFVKETYMATGATEPRESVIVYFLVQTVSGWKIYRTSSC